MATLPKTLLLATFAENATEARERRLLKADIDKKLREDLEDIVNARQATDRFGDPISVVSSDSVTIAPKGSRVNKPSRLVADLTRNKTLLGIVREVLKEMSTSTTTLSLEKHRKKGYCTVKVKFAN